MSDIPYPHSVEIRRPLYDPVLEDDEGRPLYNGETTTVVRAWVQEKTAVQQANFAAAGAEVSTHTVFMEHRLWSVGEYIVTVPGGGIEAQRHRVVGARNPAGIADHDEVDTVLVGPVESS